MYIDITNHCPLKCDHCLRNFGKGMRTQGQHMDSHTFRLALDIAKEFSGSVSLGGGEPLSHPQFWDFFLWTSWLDLDGGFWLSTSGHNELRTRTLMAIASGDIYHLEPDEHEFEHESTNDEYYEWEIGGYMDRLGSFIVEQQNGSNPKFSMQISQDYFHQNQAKYSSNCNQVSINDQPNRKVLKLGRAIETGVYTERTDKYCEGMHVDWKGNVSMCRTNPKAKLGHVSDMDITDKIYQYNEISDNGCSFDLTNEQWKQINGM